MDLIVLLGLGFCFWKIVCFFNAGFNESTKELYDYKESHPEEYKRKMANLDK